MAVWALIVASMIFYSWWEPRYLPLILISVLANYTLGLLLSKTKTTSAFIRLWVLRFGIAANLGALCWFKYANFFVDSGNQILGTDIHLQQILLPLAISFFTFQQIAYLVDAYRSNQSETSFQRYALFVTFFPQLIAGPIVHHKEMLPQFSRQLYGLKLNNLIVGGTIFLIGLFKKVIIADGVAPYSDTVFALAAAGETLTVLEAWTGALAYSLQLYFDFSGYSDMAIGLGKLFGLSLPLNFNSPYKSASIIDFWRRWHMTLSRFLRDYLYFSLGGNRKSASRTYINLILVMLLGGLWHGAGWTFVLWGGMHGLFLLINHGWRKLVATSASAESVSLPRKLLSLSFNHAVTLLAIVFAWVMFRAENTTTALTMYQAMLGFNGIALPAEWVYNHAAMAQTLSAIGVQFQTLTNMGPLFTPLRDIAVLSGMQIQVDSVGTLTALFSLFLPIAFALFWPNTQQIMARFYTAPSAQGAAHSWYQWRINRIFASLTALVGAYACFGGGGVSQFLYFQF